MVYLCNSMLALQGQLLRRQVRRMQLLVCTCLYISSYASLQIAMVACNLYSEPLIIRTTLCCMCPTLQLQS